MQRVEDEQGECERAHGGIIEPVWCASRRLFGMGCETGRDDEKPVHRVWVNAFELATHQLTMRSTDAFLPRQVVRPAQWNDSNLMIRGCLSSRCPGMSDAYCQWLSARRRSVSLADRAEWNAAARRRGFAVFVGARLQIVPDYARGGRMPGAVGLYPPNAYGFTISATTFMNGARTGTTTAIRTLSGTNPQGLGVAAAVLRVAGLAAPY